MIYLVLSLGTKLPLVHVVKALDTSLSLLGHQVTFNAQLDLPFRLGHKDTRQAPWSLWCHLH
jgi:hypothetical protein